MLKNLKVRGKIILLATIMIIFMILTAVIGFINLMSSHNSASSLYHDNLVSIEFGGDLRTQTRANSANLYALILNKENSERNAIYQDIQKRKKTIKADMLELKKLCHNDKQKKLFTLIKNNLDKWEEVINSTTDLIKDNTQNEAYSFFKENVSTLEDYQTSVRDLNNYNSRLADKDDSSNDSNYSFTIIIVIILLIVVIVIAMLVTYLISRNITTPLGGCIEHLKLVATGDFSAVLPQQYINRRDEIGNLSKAVASMQSSVNKLIKNVSDEAVSIIDVVDSVNSNVHNLNMNIEEVSATTEELSAAMEETAASSQQMSATAQEIEKAVQTIAQKSQEGALEAGEISKRAEETKENVQAAKAKASEIFLSTRGELEKAIEQSKIVDKIDVLSQAIMQITEQTNLLALNAAIEAARAGEAGKGFSVVAEEIRTLAEQSKNTVGEIQNITSKVTEAVTLLADNSNRLLTFMSKDVNNDYNTLLEVSEKYDSDAQYVDSLVTEFSSTSEELLASITDVLKAIDGVAQAAGEGASGTTDIANRISSVTDKSNDVLEETQKANGSAEKLKTEISRFKI